ncbi:MAG: MFS transporter [Clostridiales bacterium]|nr:MFS transporter [Clostridiales bacterium]
MSNIASPLSKGFLWKQRVGFGAIDFGRQIAQSLADTYLSAYLLNVVFGGLDETNYAKAAAAVSLMFIVCKLIDACSDFIIGALVDRTHTKIGRARPWIYGGCGVFLVGLLMLFGTATLFDGSSIAATMVFTYFAYVIYTTGLTMVNIPEGSLMNFMTSDQKERNMLATVRGITGGLGTSLIGSVVAPLVALLGSSNDAVGYLRTALLLGIVMVVMVAAGNTAVCEAKAQEAPEQQAGKAARKPGSNGSLLKNLKAYITTKNFVVELLFCFGNLFYVISLMSTMTYYITYQMNGNFTIMGLAMTAYSVAGLVSPLVVPSLANRLGKRPIALIGIGIAAVGVALRFLAPSTASMMVIGMVIAGFGGGFVGCMIQSTQPDIVDELTVKTRSINAGVIMASFSLACQIGSGIASSLIAGILGASSYLGGAATQTASAMSAINFVWGGLPLLSLALIFVAMSFYDLDKKHKEFEPELEKIRQEQGM